MTAPKFGNHTVLGVTEQGVAHDDSQLSREEALAALPVITEDEPAALPVIDIGEPKSHDAHFYPDRQGEGIVEFDEEPVKKKVATALRQNGVSPKLLADFIVSVVVFAVLALTGFPITNDPVITAFLAKVAGAVASYLIGPGDVVVDANDLKEVSP